MSISGLVYVLHHVSFMSRMTDSLLCFLVAPGSPASEVVQLVAESIEDGDDEDGTV